MCRAIKNDPATQALPILALSNHQASEEDGQDALAGVTDGHLWKPILEKELLVSVQDLLGDADKRSISA